MDDLFLMLFFVSLVCLVVGLIKPTAFSRDVEGKVTSKKIRFTFGIGAVAFFVLFGITTDSEKWKHYIANQNQKPTSQNEPAEQPKRSTTSDKLLSAAVDQFTKTTIDKLWTALDRSMKTRDGYAIEYDYGTKTVNLTDTVMSFFDGSSLVAHAYATLVKYGTKAFMIEGVTTITVVFKTLYVDTYGKATIDDVVILTMSRGEFSKYNWKSLALVKLPIHRQMEASCSRYYIDPEVLQDLDYSELYLRL